MPDQLDLTTLGPWGAVTAALTALAGALGWGRGKAKGAPSGPSQGERIGQLEQKIAVVEALYRAREAGMGKQRDELDELNDFASAHKARLEDVLRRLDNLEKRP